MVCLSKQHEFRSLEHSQTKNCYIALNLTPYILNLTHDDDGNCTSADLESGEWTFTWDAENRLIAAEKSGLRLEFKYDYMSRRVEKRVLNDGIETSKKHFIYDDYKLIEVLDALNSNAIQQKIVWNGETPLTIYDSSLNQTFYYFLDANKNVSELLDSSGNIVAHYEYSPFGKIIAQSGTYADENPIRFSSEYFDQETGLVYYNYRYYSPELGRWMSRDPIEEEGGMNLYVMLSNNSINRVDYLGFTGETCKPCCNGEIYDPSIQGCCAGKIYTLATECCCNDTTIALSNEIKLEYIMIKYLTKLYSEPTNKCLYGGRSNKSYWAIGFWGEPYQCSEQAAQYIEVILSLKLVWWNADIIGGKGIILKHHVARISCACRIGDCPYTGEDFIIDPFNSDFSGRKTEKDFWSEWKAPITGMPLK